MASTRVSGMGCEWQPENFGAFWEEYCYIISYGKESERCFLFRGQRDYQWLLDSTIACSIKRILDVEPPYKLRDDMRRLDWINKLFGWMLIYKFRIRKQH